MLNLTPFKLPSTATCIVLWHRDDRFHETMIATPKTHMGLRDAAIKQGIGYSEIRAVKADPQGLLQSVADINPAALRYSMTAL